MKSAFIIIACVCAISGMFLTVQSFTVAEHWKLSSFSWNGACLFYWAYNMAKRKVVS